MTKPTTIPVDRPTQSSLPARGKFTIEPLSSIVKPHPIPTTAPHLTSNSLVSTPRKIPIASLRETSPEPEVRDMFSASGSIIPRLSIPQNEDMPSRITSQDAIGSLGSSTIIAPIPRRISSRSVAHSVHSLQDEDRPRRPSNDDHRLFPNSLWKDQRSHYASPSVARTIVGSNVGERTIKPDSLHRLGDFKFILQELQSSVNGSSVDTTLMRDGQKPVDELEVEWCYHCDKCKDRKQMELREVPGDMGEEGGLWWVCKYGCGEESATPSPR